MADERPYIFDLDPDTLKQHVVAWGLPPYRADQVLDWLYGRYIAHPLHMTNLSRRDRELLDDRLCFTRSRISRHLRATDGTHKLLLAWHDTQRPPREAALPVHPENLPQTECVMIPAQDATKIRRTACVSSQVGCPVGCKFCASGLDGLQDNLSAGQIVEQVWRLGALEEVERITNVVFMGMGEPLANLNNVVAAVRTLMADWATGISGRRITLSTVGLPAPMRRLAELDLPITLAISLHAPNDEIRRQIIPWAQRVSIAELIEAGRYYFERTGREITLEYVLLHQVNDRPEHARELAEVARSLRSNVNLIRYNEVPGLPFARPEDRDVRTFKDILTQAGVNTHIRASRGRDIAAACGQLRQQTQQERTTTAMKSQTN